MTAPQPINIQHPKRILVITLRYLGDALLVTPLISSLKQAYPNAEIDVLLPAGNLGIFTGNREICRLIPMVDKTDKTGFGKLLLKLFYRYDLAIATQAGDRPVLCALLAGRCSLGFVAESAAKYSWKRWFLTRALSFSEQYSHAVLENLRFCQVLGIAPHYRLTPPRTAKENAKPKKLVGQYAVLHIMPQWRYKQWHEQGWLEIGYFLNQKGYALILTGGMQASELAAVSRLQHRLPPSTRNLAGKLTLAQLTELIETASLFIGPDTGVTHLAAATGVPTFALFGPTDPEKWAPWPFEYAQNKPPFKAHGNQKNQNVWLIQGAAPQGCVPCQQEGCDRHRHSHSACLDNLSAETLINSVQQCIT